MRMPKSTQQTQISHSRLSIRQQVQIALTMLLLLLLTLVFLGYWVIHSESIQHDLAAQGREQLATVKTLQTSFTRLQSALDQLLLTRQFALLETLLNPANTDFNQRVLSIQAQELGLFPETRAANAEILQELQKLHTNLSGITAELNRAARESRWVSYAWIRHKDLLPTERQISELLSGLETNLQSDLAQKDTGLPPVMSNITLYAALALTAILVTILLQLILGRNLHRSLTAISSRIEAVNRGEFNPFTPLSGKDEVAILSQHTSQLVSHLGTVLQGLENQLAERTQNLERRSMQMQVAAEVARDIATTRNPNVLLSQAVDLIRERFGFYHAGIFLVDEENEYAVLRAATGEAGQEMLRRGHHLKVGETGLVGYATHRGEARIALDVGEDAVHFRNPLLPETRSEMALPLKIDDRTIGALDVQSSAANAFTQDDIVSLQALADQLSVAIDNAHLMEQLSSSVHELETLYGRHGSEVWEQFTKGKQTQGYRYERAGIMPILAEELVQANLAEGDGVVSVPLEVRGSTIGTLEVWPEDEGLPDEEYQLVKAIAGRISQALETARLFNEAQDRANREQVINQISANISRSIDIDALLQTAVHELGQLPQVLEASVHIGPVEDLFADQIKGRGKA